MGQGDVQGEPSSLGEGVESYPEQPEILGRGGGEPLGGIDPLPSGGGQCSFSETLD